MYTVDLASSSEHTVGVIDFAVLEFAFIVITSTGFLSIYDFKRIIFLEYKLLFSPGTWDREPRMLDNFSPKCVIPLHGMPHDLKPNPFDNSFLAVITDKRLHLFKLSIASLSA